MVLSRGPVVGLLFCISLLTYIDRWSAAAILNDLQAPTITSNGRVSGGFGLTDTQGGLVTSVFIVAYMILSPVFGYYGDRMPRIPLLFLGIAVWSVATFASSFAHYYWQFLVFRALVGAGEASYAVLAPTLIADLYPAGPERTRVLGYYCASIPLGSALGYVYAGEVARILSWRYVFRFSPIVSLLLSSVLLTCVHEPGRGGADAASNRSSAMEKLPSTEETLTTSPSPLPTREARDSNTPNVMESQSLDRTGYMSFLRDVLIVLKTRSFAFSNLGAIGMTFTAGALAQWAPSFLQRMHCAIGDVDCDSKVTRTFGAITIVTGVAGTISGAALAKYVGRFTTAADSLVCGVGLLLATPAVYMAIYIAPIRHNATWASIFIGEWLVSVVWAPYTAILLSVVVPNLRSTANSLSLLTMHLFGDSMSPLLVGVAADELYDNGTGMTRATALQHALYLSVISTVVGAFFFLYAGNFLASDRALVALATGDMRQLGMENELGDEDANQRNQVDSMLQRRKTAGTYQPGDHSVPGSTISQNGKYEDDTDVLAMAAPPQAMSVDIVSHVNGAQR